MTRVESPWLSDTPTILPPPALPAARGLSDTPTILPPALPLKASWSRLALSAAAFRWQSSLRSRFYGKNGVSVGGQSVQNAHK